MIKRIPQVFLALVLGFVLAGADGCSSDPNVEGAKLDLRNQDYDRALENLETALENNPENAEALMLKGDVLREMAFEDPALRSDIAEHTRVLEEMVTAYERAVEVDPTLQPEVEQALRYAYAQEFERGGEAFNRGQSDQAAYNDAVAYFANAATIFPDSAGAYVNQGYALLNAGQQAEAIAPFEAAIERGENRADTYVFLASLYQEEDRDEDAVVILEDASELFPENTDIQAQLLNAYIQAGQTDRALETYRSAVEREPNNSMYRYNYGTLLLQAGRYEDAIVELTRAAELDSENPNVYYNLGAAYTNLAKDVNEEVVAMDDELRAQRSELSQAEIEAREEQINELVEERRSYFERAVDPLERARELAEMQGGEVQGICGALYQAYVQTGQEEAASEVATCAGFDE